MTEPGSITDVPGIRVGHAQNDSAGTGCTVILCEKGAVGGVDQRGGAPGTRETDVLNPANLVDVVHAVVLTGGSAFGLNTTGGVMRYLEEKGIGYDTGVAKVPIVPAAVLFDLAVGDAKIRPDEAMGYQACKAAGSNTVRQGNVGAGTGASVGKLFGMQAAMKAGIGSASIKLPGGVVVSAIFAVNAFGDVVDPQNGRILAGARKINLKASQSTSLSMADTLTSMVKPLGKLALRIAAKSNTVIGVVATNAKLTKAEATRVAMMAQDGLARVIRPAHTMLDGDTVFSLSTGHLRTDLSTVGAYAAMVAEKSILNAIMETTSAYGLPAFRQ
ncbi:MAG: P1 family peptidase [Anaerolineaceae bacterium]|nr:P1 family peptidase [Anaerolineaceae bacterium]